jgi:hypothetical protein
VFANRKWQQGALLLNLLGTIILFYSFQATSSDFKLVTTDNPAGAIGGVGKKYDLCVSGYVLAGRNPAGMYFGGACPNWANAKFAAVVNIEHPFFVGLGFTLLILGFTLQYFAIPQPRTIAALRQELKVAKLQSKPSK